RQRFQREQRTPRTQRRQPELPPHAKNDQRAERRCRCHPEERHSVAQENSTSRMRPRDSVTRIESESPLNSSSPSLGYGGAARPFSAILAAVPTRSCPPIRHEGVLRTALDRTYWFGLLEYVTTSSSRPLKRSSR